MILISSLHQLLTEHLYHRLLELIGDITDKFYIQLHSLFFKIIKQMVYL